MDHDVEVAEPGVVADEGWIKVGVGFDLTLRQTGNDLGARGPLVLARAWPHLISNITATLEMATRPDEEDAGQDSRSLIHPERLSELSDLMRSGEVHRSVYEAWRQDTGPLPAPAPYAEGLARSGRPGSSHLIPHEDYALGFSPHLLLDENLDVPVVTFQATLEEVEFEFGSLKSRGQILLSLSAAGLGGLIWTLSNIPDVGWTRIDQAAERRALIYQIDLNIKSTPQASPCVATGVVALAREDLVKAFRAAADGDAPANVCQVQLALRALNHHPGKCDGKFGEDTKLGIASFGQARGLDPKTYAPRNGKMRLSPGSF